jgi:multiple sugar transport system permease protein
MLAVTAVVPAIYAFVGSLFTRTAFGIVFAGLGHFSIVARDTPLAHTIRITAVFAAATTALATVGGTLLGCALHTSKLRGALSLSLLLPWGIPAFILVPLWRMLLHGAGGVSVVTMLTGIRIDLLTDPVAGFASAVVVAAWTATPLVAFAVLAARRAVPTSYEEAALLEGAGRNEFTLHVFLPMSRRLLLVLVLLTWFTAVKEFTVIHLLTDGGPPFRGGISSTAIVGVTTTVEVFLYTKFTTIFDFGLVGAWSLAPLVLLTPAAILWAVAQYRPGVTRSPAVVGIRKIAGYEPAVAATALLQPFFAGTWGVPAALLYLISIRAKAFLPFALLADLAVNFIHLALSGYPEGLNPATFVSVAVAALLLSARPISHSGRSIDSGRCGSLVYSFLERSATAGSVFISSLLSYLLVWIALSRTDLMFVDRLVPEHLSIANFTELVADPAMIRAFANTLLLSLGTVLLTVSVALPASVTIASFGGKRSARLLATFQTAGAIGGIHTLVPLFLLSRALGLIDSYVPIVVVYASHTLPGAVLLMTSWLRALPRSLSETAAVEGCGSLRYLVTILFPLAKPVIMLVAMLAFVASWNGFLAPLVLLYDASKYPISLALYRLVGTIGSASPRWGLFAAASVVNLVLVGTVMTILKRSFGRTGLSSYLHGI